MKRNQIFCLRNSPKASIVLMDTDWYMYQTLSHMSFSTGYYRIKAGLDEEAEFSRTAQ